MKELKLFYKLKTAFEVSTHNHNAYMETIRKIKWDSEFFEDSEFYFIKDHVIFTTPSLDPFDMKWHPCMIFSDGSMMDIK